MSDTTVTQAPPSPAPTNNAPTVNPSVHEVPINQNPPSSHNPLGPQAPDKARSVSDSIQRAFDRASNPPPKGEKPAQKPAPAAEAKAGHNQPPEKTAPERIDLRKRPTADAPLGAPARTERGQFAPRATNEARNVATNGEQNVATGQAKNALPKAGQKAGWEALPENTPYRQPPVRMSEQAKAEWHAAPESVRGDMHRMQEEFVKAYRVYKNDFDEMSKIRHFHKMAADHGTDLHTALTNYTGMEAKLRADPIAGLDVIVNNLGLKDPESGNRIGLRDIAYHVLSQSPEQLRQLQMGNQQMAASQQIGSLHQEIQGLKQTLHQMHSQQQFHSTRSAVDNFADSHPRFDELGVQIEQELKLGFDLETAYQRAALLRPATTAAQTRDTPAQTRMPDRSIHGSPDAGSSNGTARRAQVASKTPRDAVANAMKRLHSQV
jgi:hypothetical protein